jgi:hypothetical protein
MYSVLLIMLQCFIRLPSQLAWALAYVARILFGVVFEMKIASMISIDVRYLDADACTGRKDDRNPAIRIELEGFLDINLNGSPTLV